MVHLESLYHQWQYHPRWHRPQLPQKQPGETVNDQFQLLVHMVRKESFVE